MVISVNSYVTAGSYLGLLNNCWCYLTSVNICLYVYLDTFILLTCYRAPLKGGKGGNNCVALCNPNQE